MTEYFGNRYKCHSKTQGNCVLPDGDPDHEKICGSLAAMGYRCRMGWTKGNTKDHCIDEHEQYCQRKVAQWDCNNSDVCVYGDVPEPTVFAGGQTSPDCGSIVTTPGVPNNMAENLCNALSGCLWESSKCISDDDKTPFPSDFPESQEACMDLYGDSQMCNCVKPGDSWYKQCECICEAKSNGNSDIKDACVKRMCPPCTAKGEDAWQTGELRCCCPDAGSLRLMHDYTVRCGQVEGSIRPLNYGDGDGIYNGCIQPLPCTYYADKSGSTNTYCENLGIGGMACFDENAGVCSAVTPTAEKCSQAGQSLCRF